MTLTSINLDIALYNQLKADIEKVFLNRVGVPITFTLLYKVIQEVINESAFLDGFYFEGDIKKALTKVLKG